MSSNIGFLSQIIRFSSTYVASFFTVFSNAKKFLLRNRAKCRAKVAQNLCKMAWHNACELCELSCTSVVQVVPH